MINRASQIVLKGRALPGRGQAHQHLRSEQGELKTIIGEDIYPGTLNVILNQPIQIKRGDAHELPSGRRFLCPADMSGIAVWIHRWPYMPLHVAEPISTVRLRDELQIADYGAVELSVSENNLDTLSSLSKFVWAACWKFREQLYYTSDSYSANKQLGRVQRFFKAVQHP